jgi:CHAT domain-containing protein
MRPVRKLVGTKQTLLISPDGVLNLIPFAALVDERNQYLAQRYTITYLSSGRDLLRLQVKAGSGTAPVVVANPAFHDAPTRALFLSVPIASTIDALLRNIRRGS